MKNITKLFISLMLLITPLTSESQEVPSVYIFDMSEFLSVMEKPWSIGNGIDVYTGEFVGPYFMVEVFEGMNMNYHRLEIMNSSITVYGDSINSGEVTKRFESSSLYFAPLLSTEEERRPLELKMYPNPSSSFVNFKGEFIKRLVIYDNNGKIVIRSKPMSSDFTLTTDFLSSGMYMVQIWCNDGRGIFKKLLIN